MKDNLIYVLFIVILLGTTVVFGVGAQTILRNMGIHSEVLERLMWFVGVVVGYLVCKAIFSKEEK